MAKRLSPLVFVLCCGAVLLAGCGVKEWPEPRELKERFAFAEVSAAYAENGCLLIGARFSGKTGNLADLSLELAPATPEGLDPDCPGCPFSPRTRVSFKPDDPALTRSEDAVLVTYCGIETPAPYRYRLSGENRRPGLSPAETGVLLVLP